MIMPIPIQEMQRLNIACKSVLGDEEWTRRTETASAREPFALDGIQHQSGSR